MADFEKIGSTSEIEDGKYKIVGVGGKSVAVINLGGEFFAFENTCPHMGGPVGEGIIKNGVVSCPLHAWEFDIKTGESKSNPGQKLNTFEVKFEGGEVFVKVE